MFFILILKLSQIKFSTTHVSLINAWYFHVECIYSSFLHFLLSFSSKIFTRRGFSSGRNREEFHSTPGFCSLLLRSIIVRCRERERESWQCLVVVFSATCHPVRVLCDAFIFGGRRREKKGRKEKLVETKRGITATQAPLQRSPRYFISACLYLVPRRKKDRGFESLLVKHWISSQNDRINFFAFHAAAESKPMLRIFLRTFSISLEHRELSFSAWFSLFSFGEYVIASFRSIANASKRPVIEENIFINVLCIVYETSPKFS